MSQVYGIEAHKSPGDEPEQPPVRYVVLIDSAGMDSRLARLFLVDRKQVAEFDASAPEVQLMTDSLAAAHTAGQPEWDAALGGHSDEERAGAEVYTLEV